jgi:phosphatidylethanolamine-binding protein (PEBP) family uncharacterized protein
MARSLTSPAFDDGGPIPAEYGYTEREVNPPLEVEGVPDGAETLALVMDDPDAGRIPEDHDAGGATEGQNDDGERGDGRPNPPDREHTDRFVCDALDERPDLEAGARKADLEAEIEGPVVDEERLEGTDAP